MDQQKIQAYQLGIQLQNYQAETATLNSLIGDWENKPELVAALTTLGLTDWKEELKNTNNTFNTKYILRTQEYGAASPENIKSKREEANAVYYELRNFIVAYATINATNPLYTKTVNELNALITQYNQNTTLIKYLKY